MVIIQTRQGKNGLSFIQLTRRMDMHRNTDQHFHEVLTVKEALLAVGLVWAGFSKLPTVLLLTNSLESKCDG